MPAYLTRSASHLLVVAELYCVAMMFLSLFTVSDPIDRPKAPQLSPEAAPTVDVFVPSYNESIEIVAPTLAAAKRMDYPAGKLNVFLLDDGGTDQKLASDDPVAAARAANRRSDMQALCVELGVRYLTREENTHAKAGNLNNGLAHSDGDLVAVFDADHAPARDFLTETAGFFGADEKLFLVQTPHFFLNPDPIEKNIAALGLPAENEMFYGLVQKGLDKWNAAFFCGSAALLRRAALEQVGGFHGSSITEDAESALELHSRGWNTAEALVRTGDEARATAAYRYVLTNCTPADLRLATVQKASLLLTAPGALDDLIAMGHRTADGHGEFEQVRLDRVRKRIGDATGDAASPQPTPEEVAAVAASAAGPTGQADAQLLGWYARSRKDYVGAERWFRTALTAGPSAKAAEGLVLALRDGGNTTEARRLAFQYAGLDPLNRKLMVEVAAAALSDSKAQPIAPDELKSVMDATDALKSSDGAQALGWHLYQQNDVTGAEGWFRKSMDYGANEPAAVGLVVVARRLRHDRDYAARIAAYRGVYPRMAKLETLMRSRSAPRRPVAVAQAHRATGRLAKVARANHRTSVAAGGGWDRSADDIIRTYNAGQYDTAMTLLEQRRQRHAEPHGLSVIRGWALYHKGDWDGAKQVFSGLDGGSYSRERQEGLRVVQEGYIPPRLR